MVESADLDSTSYFSFLNEYRKSKNLGTSDSKCSIKSIAGFIIRNTAVLHL